MESENLRDAQKNLYKELHENAVSKFIDYAKDKGSKSPETYHMNVNKMINLELDINKGERDKLNNEELFQLTAAESLVATCLMTGMKQKKNYKEIFQFAKNQVSSLKKLFLSNENSI